MKYLVISDIHGNATALERIAEEIGALRPDFTVSLGDVVGYGASPADCVDIVDSACDIKIMGNHDYVAAGLADSENFNVTARISIEWTKGLLSARHKELLSAYHTVRRHGDCLFAHSSPISPLDWEYVYTMAQAERIFSETDARLIFVGHTHVPGIISHRPGMGCRVESGLKIDMEPGRRYLVNTGSVGQPRDGVSAASFALVDVQRGRINIRRIPYNVGEAQEKIRAQGLPEALASRLALAK
jgi:diadenosine tetraphosphatase ApaH/serine/threonine PP2A family protein phosphatase